MKSHKDIIDLWPSLSEYARDLDVAYGTAQVMRWRGSIHPRHWDDIVQSARRRGLPVTYELLSKTRSGARGKRPKKRVSARALTAA